MIVMHLARDHELGLGVVVSDECNSVFLGFPSGAIYANGRPIVLWVSSKPCHVHVTHHPRDQTVITNQELATRQVTQGPLLLCKSCRPLYTASETKPHEPDMARVLSYSKRGSAGLPPGSYIGLGSVRALTLPASSARFPTTAFRFLSRVVKQHSFTPSGHHTPPSDDCQTRGCECKDQVLSCVAESDTTLEW